jgi:tRNA 2-selenouridine synthase
MEAFFVYSINLVYFVVNKTMPIQKIEITEFLALSKKHLLIDVRSPSEYTHAHIPNAKNIALFNDEQRKIIGTAYKQENKQVAIKLGLDFFGPKMRKIVEEVEQMSVGNWQLAIASVQRAGGTGQMAEGKWQVAGGSGQFAESNIQNEPDCPLPPATCILIHCWRGGMRSQAVAWLLDLYGFNVYLLQGGYKAYRNWVLQQFEKEYNFKILGGYTGSGKTYLLEALQKNGETVIDLEGIASHKGSALGALGMGKQPTQEMFENKLAKELYEKSFLTNTLETNNTEESINNAQHSSSTPNNKSICVEPITNCQLPTENIQPSTANCIWLEDESQRIGLVQLPIMLWNKMRSSKVFFIDIPFEERLEFLTKEYGLHKKEDLVNAIMRIQKRLGGLETKNAINFLLENNFKESFRILLNYYDKYYLKGLYNRENAEELINKIQAKNVQAEDNLKKIKPKLSYFDL